MYAEFLAASNNFMFADQNAELLKEFADLKYVIDQYCAMLGWDIDEAEKRVHENNMNKAGPDGKVVYRSDGKILKPANYKPVDLRDLVEE